MSSKEAYRRKVEAQMDEWQAEIDKLVAQSKGKEADSEIQYNKWIRELKSKKAAAQSRLDNVNKASTDAWEDLKDGVQKATNDLSDAIKSAKKHFS
tara:strand:+ start:277 stop:564 length:288 start_codon:yes stop_codon:yes gene_type:complete